MKKSNQKNCIKAFCNLYGRTNPTIVLSFILLQSPLNDLKREVVVFKVYSFDQSHHICGDGLPAFFEFLDYVGQASGALINKIRTKVTELL